MSVRANKEGTMNIDPLYVTIGSSLISGLLGVGISAWFFDRLERRKLKVDTARRLIGFRFNTASSEFQQALNEILVVFADESDVIEAIKELYENLENSHKPDSGVIDDASLTKVLKLVCSSIGLHPKQFDDKDYLKIFGSSKGLQKQKAEP